jgi:RNA polymerase sigma-70 factor (ECF subfamily)
LKERTAQNKFYEKYKKLVYGVCMRYANSAEETEDFCQESFIRIFDSIIKKPTTEILSLKGWIATITVRTAIDQLRKKKKIVYEDISNQERALPHIKNTALESFSADELILLLHAMPDGYRIIFNMYVIEGYSHKEISEILEIPESTSRSQFARGKDWLKRKLKQINHYGKY